MFRIATAAAALTFVAYTGGNVVRAETPRQPGTFWVALNAVQSDNSAELRQLLGRGLDPNAADPQGVSLLMHAASVRSEAAASTLVRAGAAVNARDAHGMTSLMWAARSRAVPVIQLLLESGADKALNDRNGVSALQHARRAASERRIHVPFTDIQFRAGHLFPVSLDPAVRALSN